MANHKLLLLAGDGIGPEVMAEVKRLLGFYARKGIANFTVDEGLVGGCCYDAHKVAITEETMAKAQAADAVIFGACGGPKWDDVPYDVRPEAGLLRLRKDLGLGIHQFAELDFERFGNPSVQLLPRAAQQTAMCRVLHQRVLEAVDRVGRHATLKYQLGTHKATESDLQFVFGKRGDGAQQWVRKLASDRSADLRHMPHRRQAV